MSKQGEANWRIDKHQDQNCKADVTETSMRRRVQLFGSAGLEQCILLDALLMVERRWGTGSSRDVPGS